MYKQISLKMVFVAVTIRLMPGWVPSLYNIEYSFSFLVSHFANAFVLKNKYFYMLQLAVSNFMVQCICSLY